MRVETVRPNGPSSWVVGLVGTQSEKFRRVTLSAEDLTRVEVADDRQAFDGDSHLHRLGIQAYALGIAYGFDPYFGLSISRVDPLPHQLEAVYDYLLKAARAHYVVTDCDINPKLQEPVKDPARLEWHEVTKVVHYYLSVQALSGVMHIRQDTQAYQARTDE